MKNKKIIWIFVTIILILIPIIYSYYEFGIKKESSQVELKTNSSSYVRPPFGIKFKTKTNNDFVVSYSHFDSPGINKSRNENSSKIKSQGNQEVSEASNTINVVKEYETYFKSKNIFFMADTNILVNNQKKAFVEDNFKKNNYSFLFEDKPTYNTSLSSSYNKFANPYDKVIYKLNNQFEFDENQKDLDLVKKENIKKGFIINTFKTLNKSNIDKANKFVDDNFKIKNNSNWINYNESIYLSSKNWNKKNDAEKIYNYVKYSISDHLPIGFDLKETKNKNEIYRIGMWNVLNLSFWDSNMKKQKDDFSKLSELKKRNFEHLKNLATIVIKAKYDLIGFIEINKNNKQQNLNYFIDYLNQNSTSKKYKGILTENTPSKIASENQVEQVAIIYNENKLFFDKSINPYFYGSNKKQNWILLSNLNYYFLNLKNIFLASNKKEF